MKISAKVTCETTRFVILEYIFSECAQYGLAHLFCTKQKQFWWNSEGKFPFSCRLGSSSSRGPARNIQKSSSLHQIFFFLCPRFLFKANSLQCAGSSFAVAPAGLFQALPFFDLSIIRPKVMYDTNIFKPRHWMGEGPKKPGLVNHSLKARLLPSPAALNRLPP